MTEKVTAPYWLEIPLIKGDKSPPQSGELLIIGSGLSGVSTAYWLMQEGFKDLTLVDFEPERSASFRNAGHILYGTVESMKALREIHGQDAARSIWSYSISLCETVKDTVDRLKLDADYKQDGYLVMAVDKTEDHEIKESIELLNHFGFDSSYVDGNELQRLGFRNVYGARYEKGSAQAHPVKFRNGLLDYCLKRGLNYHSGIKITSVEESRDKVEVKAANGEVFFYDATVIAANAYSPLLSSFFREKRLIEPFKGQIIVSAPLKHHQFKVTYPHSFDHGYEYALVTKENRLLIGGWRNHVPGLETGTYDLTPNPLTEVGLKQFVRDHYHLGEDLEWQYSWSGIMAASKTGFPFIGPTSSPRIFTCSGYTGHGFSWAHGSAKLLADIIAGNPVPEVARYFNPKSL